MIYLERDVEDIVINPPEVLHRDDCAFLVPATSLLRGESPVFLGLHVFRMHVFLYPTLKVFSLLIYLDTIPTQLLFQAIERRQREEMPRQMCTWNIKEHVRPIAARFRLVNALSRATRRFYWMLGLTWYLGVV